MDEDSAVEPTVAPDDIDTDFCPRVQPDVVAVDIGDDTVLLGSLGQSHVVNRTGALLWRFFDGETTLAELVEDFAEALDTHPGVVREDIMGFTRTLGRAGLLEHVAEPPEGANLLEFRWEPAEPVSVGDALPTFVLPDLEGSERSIEAWRGRRVLLVNWSPGCGFCVKIADQLAVAEEPLAEHGVDLVFVTTGDPEENRRVFDEAGLQAPALVKRDDVDPFRGFGTPAAYLLDRDGRVAALMALGADQVPRLADQVAGIEPHEPTDASPNSAGGDGGLTAARYLPAPSAVCGPGGGTSATNTEWIGTRAFRVGEFHVGIRYNEAEVAEVLDRLFCGAGVRDSQVPDNYSVALYPASGRGSRNLNLLVQGSTQLVRSRSAARALAALLSYVSAETQPPGSAPGLLRVRATAAVRHGCAIVLPPGLVGSLKQLQPRLARRSIVLADGPFAVIDPGACELLVPEPWFPYDATVLSGVGEGARLGSELAYVRPGRYPLTDWYLTRPEDEIGSLSPGLGVASAYPLVIDKTTPGETGQALAGLFEHVAAHGVWLGRVESLVAQLDAV